MTELVLVIMCVVLAMFSVAVLHDQQRTRRRARDAETRAMRESERAEFPASEYQRYRAQAQARRIERKADR